MKKTMKAIGYLEHRQNFKFDGVQLKKLWQRYFLSRNDDLFSLPLWNAVRSVTCYLTKLHRKKLFEFGVLCLYHIVITL